MGLPDTMLALACMIAFAIGFWLLINRLTPFDDGAEYRDKNNSAYALRRGGILVGQAIAMSSAISIYGANQTAANFGWFLLALAWICVALMVSMFAVDKLVLVRVDNLKLLREGNLAVGFTEAGAYIGIGMILGSSLIGSGHSMLTTMASAVVFFLLGLLLICAAFWLLELATPYRLHDWLVAGKTTAGIETGLALVAISYAASPSVAGDVVSWGASLSGFGLTALVSVVLLIGSWLLVERFGPGHGAQQTHEQDNVAMSVARSAFIVMLSIAVNAAIVNVL